MAHFQNQYGATPTPQSDQYGNPVIHTDEFGNPVHHQTGMTGMTGGAGGVYNTGFVHDTGVTGHQQGKLHRSGSSSSSSSEDDGEGGRRKKGIGQKIKEKLPGKNHDQQTHSTPTTTPGGGHGGAGMHVHGGAGMHEKKGLMDKIKDKLPGHRDDHHSA